MDHMTVHVTTVILVMASNVPTSTNARKASTIAIPMPNVRIASVVLNELVETASKVMEPRALISMNVPMDSTTATMIVIATIPLVHSCVAVKMDS